MVKSIKVKMLKLQNNNIQNIRITCFLWGVIICAPRFNLMYYFPYPNGKLGGPLGELK